MAKIFPRSLAIKIFVAILCALSLTFLRPALFVLVPFYFVAFVLLFNARGTKSTAILIGLIIINTILGSAYLAEWNPANNLLSLYFIIPLVAFFFFRIKISDQNYLQYFIKVVTVILIFNNLIAFTQFLRNPMDDDSFNGFYGTHGLGLHTLSLVNYMISAYYFMLYQQYKLKISLLLSLFFLVSAVLCFYGLGLIVFLLSIFVYKFSFRNLFKSVLAFSVIMSLVAGSLYLFRPITFAYNLENIKRATFFFRKDVDPKLVRLIPRKLFVFKNYVEVYPTDAGLFLLGSGPGTFNSRSYFLLNGDYSRSEFLENALGVHEPLYAGKYVHPLWNSGNTGQYMDGTRNEPFSSVIALLAEYGFIIFFVICILIHSKYKKTINLIKQKKQEIHLAYYLKFVSLFMLLNLFTDNFLEYPEIMIIYIFIFKLIEMKTHEEKLT